MKMPAWSYTALTAFETCPRRYYHTRVAKSVSDPPGEAALWGQRVHKAMEERILHRKPMPEGMEKWASLADKIARASGKPLVEQQIALDEAFRPVSWFAKNAWVRGVIDAGIIRGAKATFVDWKTGKRQPENDQLKLFAGLGFCQYPKVKVINTGFFWLKDNKVDKAEFSKEESPVIWQEFMPRVRRLEEAYANETWPARQSGLCKDWCPVPKSICVFSGRGG